jgi:hypothetical protein
METGMPSTLSRPIGRVLRATALLVAACAALPNLGCEMIRHAQLGTDVAPSAEPSVDQCATANEHAQTLQRTAKLRQAKEELLVCVARSCPGPVRDDCVERLGEVERATPTIVFVVKDASGAALDAVKVQSDDAILTDHLDGGALAVDPGKHHFTFTAPDGSLMRRDLFIREGEKARHESVVVGGRAPAHDEVPAGFLVVDSTAAISEDWKAAARLLGTEGLELAASGDCPSAVDKLTRAEAIVHVPTTAVLLAQCEIKLGKLVAGTEGLQRVVHDTYPLSAPKSWRDASRQAAAMLVAAESRVARLRVHVDVPAGATADVRAEVDGEPLASVLLDNDRPTDPGNHRIVARAPGLASAQADVSLADGQSQTVTLRLERTPFAASAPPAAAAFHGADASR